MMMTIHLDGKHLYFPSYEEHVTTSGAVTPYEPQTPTRCQSTFSCFLPHLYDFARRFAGFCLLGDEDRRWVVANAGASEMEPRRWSLLGEPEPEPPPLDNGELTRWLGKVELE